MASSSGHIISSLTDREAMPRWTLHDLRRTGRSLMSRAKVPSDHAERVLGHVIVGVRETYDRYEYLEEKQQALMRLSNLLHEIIKQRTAHIARIGSRSSGISRGLRKIVTFACFGYCRSLVRIQLPRPIRYFRSKCLAI